MQITVAGAGYVGLVTSACLAELGHNVTCIDIEEEKISMLRKGRPPIFEPGLHSLLEKKLHSGHLHFTTNPDYAYSNAEVIFIAVGTPEHPDGSVNLEYLYTAVCTMTDHLQNDVVICTKSTVPVGTNDKIKQIIECNKPPSIQAEVVSNPEFLREGTAIHDFFHADRIVIGTEHPEEVTVLEQIYQPLNIPIFKTDVRSAEMIKYASNAFLATKITFINEIAHICEKVGATIEDVAKGIGKDCRIGPQFLKAGFGYGGSCFPKDTKALVHLAANLDYQFEILNSVIKVNNKQQSLAVQKAKMTIGSLNGKRVSVLGLSYKPGTDDMREAASLKIIQELLDEGASVTTYDPVAIPNAIKIFGKTIEYETNIRYALLGAELAIIATEWDQIKHLPLADYESYMCNPIIIDGRNCFSLKEIEKHSIIYISIGRPPINLKNLPNSIIENHFVLGTNQ
ncbi:MULTISPECIES: UDP-glucose dehydrogenase family protein [Bacillaceae]|uniref:UDP-glucose dehydrogenase family protein n=1 Tax=Bacillaceae TaxID=186817 RepID=UPI002FFE920B